MEYSLKLYLAENVKKEILKKLKFMEKNFHLT